MRRMSMSRPERAHAASGRRAAPVLVCLSLILSGCVSGPPPLPSWAAPPSESVRSGAGRVGVMSSPVPPVVEVSGPARTRGQGTVNAMWEGAGNGAAVGCMLTLYLCPLGAVAGGIIGLVAGAPVGSVLAEPDLVEAREAALQQVVGGMAFGRALRDRVTALGQERTA